ncbi:MAG: hypothetical protein A3F42_08115 [Gammaproteobacteria bacterium RIFCSPHIGHO2_12_FULL_37_34]|nr:MAG: hypothetical protein A3F42_08115 [Gammaproteobacteria bacterium RIFCSPHIGHO2_12_FULL_37_34]
MPEILTKHPKIVLQLLNDIGAKCGKGDEQHILTQCPRENFCLLPTGELCVYDIKNIASMTQMDTYDLHEAISHVPTMFNFINILLLTIIFLLGIWVGYKKMK